MSKFDWRNGFAVGLTVGIFGTATLLVWGEKLYDFGNCISANKCENYSTYYENPNEPEWWYWTTRLISTEDTLAQWIMATFTIGAVLLLWRTLIYTRRTLNEAKEATSAAKDTVRVTREIGISQTRAYINCFDAGIKNFRVGETPEYFISIRNIGQSPARNVRVAIATRGCDDPDTKAIKNLVVAKAENIAPTGHLPHCKKFDNPLSQEWFDAVMAKQKSIALVGYIIYNDVFGKTRRTVFRYGTDPDSLNEGKIGFDVCVKNNRST